MSHQREPRVQPAVRRYLEQRLKAERGLTVAAWVPIRGGMQNRLFRLDTLDGPALLAKLYHRDRWNRLEREWAALTFLGERGLARVPRTYAYSEEHACGVYSFEPGEPRRAAELKDADIRAVATFAAELHTLSPAAGDDLLPAADASFSVEQQLGVIDARLGAFEAFAARPDAYAEVRDLARQLDLRAAVAELIRRLTDSLAADERRATLPRQVWRLNSGDFGPNNLLLTADGRLTVVDWEAAGWDDPARLVMGFVAHATSEDLASGQATTFLRTYAQASGLSTSEVARFERVGALLELEWVAIYASALTADAVAAKQFANRDLDRSAYLSGTIDRLKSRLERARSGAICRSWPS